MKVLMVLTSHDKLGNTGRKTGFWLEEFAAPLLHVQGSRRRDRAHLAEGRPTASRSEEQRAELSDRTYAAVRSRCGRKSTARDNTSRRQRQGRGLRHRLLPRRPRPDVGWQRIRTRSGCSNHSWPPARPSRWSATRRARCVTHAVHRLQSAHHPPVPFQHEPRCIASADRVNRIENRLLGRVKRAQATNMPPPKAPPRSCVAPLEEVRPRRTGVLLWLSLHLLLGAQLIRIGRGA